ncbi:hypothetical protein AB0G06_04935 [Nonomuraea dietziae]|uniref:hypothetical protein n=1 Tax=Nonomuraea dietziae TaxID=65515 RepID=UPI0033CC2F18
MSMIGNPEQPDPVLAQLSEWAETNGMTAADLAKRLEITPTTLSSWLTAYRSQMRGEQVPPSGRRFRYTRQPSSLRLRIAELLAVPEEKLRLQSLSVRKEAEAQRAARTATSVGYVEAFADRSDLSSSLVSKLVVNRFRTPKSIRHHVAEVVTSVPGVATTVLIPEYRGRDRTDPYQYQLVIFAEPNSVVATDELKKQIGEELAKAGLQAYWEHGALTPPIAFTGREDEASWLRLGSLVILELSAPRSPATGLLLPPGPRALDQQLRLAAIITPPYGGSDPIGGFLAGALELGHLRVGDIVRAYNDAKAKRDPRMRAALPPAPADIEAGYALEQGLDLLWRGEAPGAWLMTMEVRPAALYDPLWRRLINIDSPLMIVRLGPRWQKAASWRLATASLNCGEGTDGTAGISPILTPGQMLSSDQIKVRPGQSLTKEERSVLDRQIARANACADELAWWDRRLVEMIEKRSAPTLVVMLENLPDDGKAVRFDRGAYEPVTGDDRFYGNIIFPDNVDGFVDAWLDASIDLLGQLAVVAGYSGIDDVLPMLADGPLQRAVRKDSL